MQIDIHTYISPIYVYIYIYIIYLFETIVSNAWPTSELEIIKEIAIKNGYEKKLIDQ